MQLHQLPLADQRRLRSLPSKGMTPKERGRLHRQSQAPMLAVLEGLHPAEEDELDPWAMAASNSEAGVIQAKCSR